MEVIKTQTEATELKYEHTSKRFLQIALYCLVLSVSVGGLGPAGVLVAAIEDYYNINDIVYNVIFLVSYVDFGSSAPVWQTCMVRYGLRPVMIAACVVTCVGYGFQGLYQFHFAPVVIGGAFVDTSRAMILVTANTFVSRWFAPGGSKNLAYGIIYVAASIMGGLILLLSRLLIGSDPDTYKNQFWYILVLMSGLSVLSLLLVVFLFEERPAKPPGPQTQPPNPENPCRNWFCPVWKEHSRNAMHVKAHIALYVFVIGGTWAIGNLLLELMKDRGYDTDDQTWNAVTYFVASITTPIWTGLILDATKAYRELVFGMVLLTAGVFGGWIAALPYRDALFGMTAVLGLVTGAYSVTYTMTISELAFPISEDQTNMICYFWAQWSAAGATVLASFAVTVDGALWLFLGIYGAVALISGILLNWPVRYKRIERQQREEEEAEAAAAAEAAETTETKGGGGKEGGEDVPLTIVSAIEESAFRER